jgi:hypothetical protein
MNEELLHLTGDERWLPVGLGLQRQEAVGERLEAVETDHALFGRLQQEFW